ncbi:metabolite traffic protein EboE [Arthrobacter antioxidans]|uniref:metabolite traffic protein EboE n=1 Tax=Arthrobacter antioxidans TaxID=2895818 RepID=UPI001FFE6D3B|nr:metabolite traffic protein EboE [Arthrobacter antioxidans]
MLLSYCTNVHPAEDLDGVLEQLRRYAGPIRRQSGLQTLGIGLWLPAGLAFRLARSGEDRERLRAALSDEGLHLHTINAFPFGGFHDDVVKLAVYEPSWARPDRLDYTKACAEVLADLLPVGMEGSISTLPLAWREGWTDESDTAATAAFVELSAFLRDLRTTTGRTIRVAVEPEPGCVLDSVADVVDWLSARVGVGLDPELVGICLDTCHLAVSFADPAAEVRRIVDAGLRVVKIQASVALEVEDPALPHAREALARFVEPRYIHQVREAAPAGVLRSDDLPEALDVLPARGPWRVHFHLPLHYQPEPPLTTTTSVLRIAVEAVAAMPHGSDAHLDIETYTWSVLPGGPVPLVEGIAAEIAWSIAHLRPHIHPSAPSE